MINVQVDIPYAVSERSFEKVRDRSSQGLVDWTTKIRLPPTGSEFEGSFRVEGNQSHHMLLLHIPLCFRIWDEEGFDVPVQAYRWHSTCA